MDRSDRHLASLNEEGRYRLLIEAVTDYAIYMLDPSGFITTWNPGAQRFKGYAAHEIIGQHFSRFYTEEDRKVGLPARALETAKQKGKFEAEGWRIRKDGTKFWAYVIIDPIRNQSGDVIGYAKITRDLTERKEAADKLEKARQISLQSQKLEAIGQLTGGIAHDFNNLLSAVLGSLELLRKRLPNDPKSIALLENAAQGAERGTALTKRMLAFARNYELKKEVARIPDVVRGMTDLLQRSLGPSFNLETRFPINLKVVEVDINQLELALLNLTLNARDAMQNGGNIIMAAREESVEQNGLPAGNYIRISVTDTGEGMDEQTLHKATEPFFTTKGVGKGTGLGLSMVHGFAEQSGGRFTLHSQKGQGTTAEIWLPIAKTPAQPVAAAPHHVTPRSVQPLTILAVDDDALVLMNTVGMLEDLGHTVFETCSGKEALEILQREDSIDLVVTDQAMPKMTGIELAKVIRSKWPDIPVLLATGYADMSRRDDIGLPKLTKPFQQRDLSAALAQLNPPRRKPDPVIPFRSPVQ